MRGPFFESKVISLEWVKWQCELSNLQSFFEWQILHKLRDQTHVIQSFKANGSSRLIGSQGHQQLGPFASLNLVSTLHTTEDAQKVLKDFEGYLSGSNQPSSCRDHDRSGFQRIQQLACNVPEKQPSRPAGQDDVWGDEYGYPQQQLIDQLNWDVIWLEAKRIGIQFDSYHSRWLPVKSRDTCAQGFEWLNGNDFWAYKAPWDLGATRLN